MTTNEVLYRLKQKIALEELIKLKNNNEVKPQKNYHERPQLYLILICFFSYSSFSQKVKLNESAKKMEGIIM
jgi:hypothetical protein